MLILPLQKTLKNIMKFLNICFGSFVALLFLRYHRYPREESAASMPVMVSDSNTLFSKQIVFLM